MNKDIVVDLTVKKHQINKKAGEPAEYVITMSNKDPNWTLTIKTNNVAYLHGLPRGETFQVALRGTSQQTLTGAQTPEPVATDEETEKEEEAL